ncbi:MAG: hypothetical protein IKH11_04605 [Bacteroidales bacterium]|nr:hypothetical protein [Bacteroidales bacterium]
MEKTIRIIPAIALGFIAAALSTSCISERQEVSRSEHNYGTHTVLFNICDVNTRATLGPAEEGVYPTLWTSNDAAVKLALNYTEAAEAVVVPSEDFRTASFTADIVDNGEAPYTFYAVSPASAAKALSPSREAWSITIPSVQTPLAASVDESAMLLAAASVPTDQLPTSVDLHFHHLTAYGRMSFKNLNLRDAVVSRVEITATTPFVGNWYWDCSDEHGLTDNGASSTLTLKTSGVTDIWFACAPVDMSGQMAVFTVYTDKGAFVKEVEFPEGRKFNAGRVAAFGVDMKGIEPVAGGSGDYVLVTNESELCDGDELLILNADETYALSTNQKSNNRGAVAASVSNHVVVTVPEEAQVITLKSGTSAGTWTLNTGIGYLANVNGSKNKLVTVTTLSKNATWTISVASSGEASIEAGDGERNKLRFNPNNGSPLFACYSSGQEAVAIFRKAAASASPAEEDPVTANSLFGIYQGADQRTYEAGKDQYVRSYSSKGIQTFTIVDPQAKEQLEISGYKKDYVKGDAVTVTVNWRKGKTRIISGKTYQVKVVKEEGPVVWLGNGRGDGFIIKK